VVREGFLCNQFKGDLGGISSYCIMFNLVKLESCAQSEWVCRSSFGRDLKIFSLYPTVAWSWSHWLYGGHYGFVASDLFCLVCDFCARIGVGFEFLLKLMQIVRDLFSRNLCVDYFLLQIISFLCVVATGRTYLFYPEVIKILKIKICSSCNFHP